MVLEQKQKGWNVECGCEKLGGGGEGFGLGEKKCQRGGRDEEGKGVFRKIGDDDTREHGEREPREKKEFGGTDWAF